MAGIRFIYRFIGMMWLLLGILFFVISIIYLVATIVINNFFLSIVPEAITSLISPILNSLPYLPQHLAGIAFGLFCLIFGYNLTILRSWTRSIGVVFHLAIGACLLALTLTLYARMTTPGLIEMVIPKTWSNYVIGIGVAFSIGILGIGIQFSTPSATEAFSGFIPKLPPIAPVKCPTCGGLLDIDKGQCSKCDNPTPIVPTRAKLIHIQANKEYPVSTRRVTRVGREMPGFEILIDDRSVSGEHAVIELVEGRFFLHALKDTNGTFVNDMDNRIRDAEIKNGDQIAFGNVQMEFIVE